eukprot:gene5712-6604_t
MIAPSIGYRVEGSSEAPATVFDCSAVPNLLEGVFDLSDNDSLYFRETFLNNEHLNFMGVPTPDTPVSISIVLDKDGKNYTALIRTSTGNNRLKVASENVRASWWRRIFRAGPSPYDILRSIAPQHYIGTKLILDPGLPQALMNLEEKQTIKGFKFGILYAQEGQTKEDEMFANVEASPEFEDSRQVHVVLLVKAVKVESDPDQRYYKLAIVSKDTVPEFGPVMPANGIFKKDQAFKDFFYAKLLNAEKASYSAPILEMKLSRTRKALLKDVSEAFC